MAPALKKLYPNKEDLSDALKRHLVFFNTEGTLGGIIQGISLAMEEEKAIEGKIPGSAITSIKTGTHGPDCRNGRWHRVGSRHARHLWYLHSLRSRGQPNRWHYAF